MPDQDELEPANARIIRAYLTQQFPWMRTDDEVNGGDVIEQLGLMMRSLDDASERQRTPVERAFYFAAKNKEQEGETEIDDHAIVSISDDGGAYVQAWLWVSNEEANVCAECGDVIDGDGFDGKCGNCADKHEGIAYACPKCEGTEHLDVCVSQWARITENSEENVQTDTDEADEHDQEWDADSAMACRACGYSAKVRDFDTTPTYRCPKCGKPHHTTAYVDQGEGPEAGRTFHYCSEHCRETH